MRGKPSVAHGFEGDCEVCKTRVEAGDWFRAYGAQVVHFDCEGKGSKRVRGTDILDEINAGIDDKIGKGGTG